DGWLRIGAGVTYTRLIDELGGRLPGLALAARAVGSPQIRNRGTVGGNLGTASPAGDALPPLLAAGAAGEVASPAGGRRGAGGGRAARRRRRVLRGGGGGGRGPDRRRPRHGGLPPARAGGAGAADAGVGLGRTPGVAAPMRLTCRVNGEERTADGLWAGES